MELEIELNPTKEERADNRIYKLEAALKEAIMAISGPGVVPIFGRKIAEWEKLLDEGW